MRKLPSSVVTLRGGVPWIWISTRASGWLSRELTTRPLTSPPLSCATPEIAPISRTPRQRMRPAFNCTLILQSWFQCSLDLVASLRQNYSDDSNHVCGDVIPIRQLASPQEFHQRSSGREHDRYR